MGVSAEQASDRLLTLLLDEASATVSYIGEAAPASSTSSPVWRIRKLDTTSGVNLLYADGDTQFNNVWDNRASLTYTT
jgi:hypothetical protein